MTDLHLHEDEATLYVLGRLTEAERDDFEARLARSTELRALVHELEEGAVAVAMASPRRRVPQQVWQNIESAVTERKASRLMDPSFWFGLLRNGWAVAAACLVGWLLYALWAGRAGTPGVAPGPLATSVNVQPAAIPTNSAPIIAVGALSQPRDPTNTDQLQSPAVSSVVTRELGALRLQNVELARLVTNLSQVVMQQQAQLSESNRLKFFQLGSSTSEGGVGSTNAMPSPGLQHALSLAMARELGWLRLPASTESGPTQTNQSGVDFVDLHPGTNELAETVNLPGQSEIQLRSTSGWPSMASVAGGVFPGFFGNRVVFAFDSSVVPIGSDLTFWTGNSIQGFQPLGSALLGNNPMVVTIPSASTAAAGLGITITAGTSAGTLNVIGQLPSSGATPP